MNKISISAIVFAFIITGVVWFFFVKGDSGDKVTSNGDVVILNESINKKDDNSSVINQEKIMNATLHTNKGDITIQFVSDLAPNTVANFVKLAKEGFYDGTKFHRVIKGFMNQGGDPFSKDDSLVDKWGTGGPGYYFADEIGPDNKNNAGTISMANAGPDTNGSQFFINVAPNNNLDTKHTVFGYVTEGIDVVMEINSLETDASDRPLEPVIIESTTLK